MADPVGLANCDSEPIHIPGSIQPHGWLLVCDAGAVIRQMSANVEALLGRGAEEVLGRPLSDVCPAFRELPLRHLALTGEARDVDLNGLQLTILVSEASGQHLIELEPRRNEPLAIDQHLPALRGLQRSRGVRETLEFVAQQVRSITGFDRVMVYRFLPDLSGEIIAEARHPEMHPYLGQRYPATDIPAQARRLYLLNLTRMIVDAAYDPVPIVPSRTPDGYDLDLSYATLRSVSPIHREYMQNMGTRASLSISIVIDGKLWGLVACHHREPKFVAHDRRALCELLAQQISALVEAEQRTEIARAEAAASDRALRIAERLAGQDEMIRALLDQAEDLLALANATGVAITVNERIGTHGAVPPREVVLRLLDEFAPGGKIVFTHEAGAKYVSLQDQAACASGLLAIRLSESAKAWVIWFRPEVISTIRWGGDPNKPVAVGPLGPRLTPRGSFDEYIETVRGQSSWWSEADLRVAARFRELLAEAMLRRAVEAARLRDLVIGTMSHDLRTPLSAISMAASMMTADTSDDDLATTITWSSRRMKRMLDNLMELSRIQAGSGIRLQRKQVDLGELSDRLVREAQLGSGGTITLTRHGDLKVDADETRLEQVLANLLSNARHHGDPLAEITLKVTGLPTAVELAVHNFGPAIPPEIQRTMFEAYSGRDLGASRGLGLGLFTVQHAVAAHGGSIEVESDAVAGTTFRVLIPRTAA